MLIRFDKSPNNEDNKKIFKDKIVICNICLFITTFLCYEYNIEFTI